MIARIAGRLVAKDIERVEIVAAGLGYEVAVPLGVAETLPAVGEDVALFTHLVVKEDAWQLYGFATAADRTVFRALLGAKGVGPALALAMLSSLTADRLVRVIREKDVATLQTVPRVGRKKAEQIVLDLADKLDDLVVVSAPPRGDGPFDDAIRGLVSLGYARADAERAVRASTGGTTAEKLRQAIKTLAGGSS